VDPGSHVGSGAGEQLGAQADAQSVDALTEPRPGGGAGPSSDVLSAGSWPPMTSRSSAASATVVAKGPIWSRELAKATRP